MDSYEKKYKEARARARVIHLSKKEMEYIFPELKESEDMKMLKEIHLYLGWLDGRKSIAPKGDYTINDMLTWIEKKSTQPRYNIGDVICDKSCTTLNKEAQPNMEIVDIKNGTYICDKGSFPVSQQDEYELVSKKIDTKLNDDSVSNELREASVKHAEKELRNQTFPDNLEFELIYTFEEGAKWDAAQKSIWSKEEEEILDEIIDFLENGTVKLQHDLSLYASLLKSLKDRVKTQQEWTMQDEEELQIALDTLVKAGQHSSAKWLKNVCLVPQNKWKPSDEQMEVLLSEVTGWKKGCSKQIVLESLYNDLKKLK